MKNALNDLMGKSSGADDMGTAAPDFQLAGEWEDDMEEGSGLLSEVEGMLGGATDEQLKQIKDILGGGAAPALPPMGDMPPPMPKGPSGGGMGGR